MADFVFVSSSSPATWVRSRQLPGRLRRGQMSRLRAGPASAGLPGRSGPAQSR